MLERQNMAAQRRARQANADIVASKSQCALTQVSMGVAILLGNSQDVQITWPRAFKTKDYAVDLIPLTGMVGRGTLAVLEDASKTTTACTVRVTAGLAISLGAQFLAHASC